MSLMRLPLAIATIALLLAASPPPASAATNHLAGQTSPYLLEHLGNPVDWYPWGDEALRRARVEDRPIFLSIGYSACHWCHVMERESFEDAGIAAVLNARFVPIKVDREERPDLDRIYMAAVVALTGGGGWPMSVFLAPNLQPFFGATYLPRDRFLEILNGVARTWAERRDQVIATAAKVQAMVEQELAAGPAAEAPVPAPELRAAAIDSLRAGFDRRDGGFGAAPKFPPYGALAILLRSHAATGDAEALDMAVRTLDAMARGGLHDQIGGGFHRYSTDARWFAPHFEKMLYDNALLAPLYLEAWKQTGRVDFRRVAEGALAWAGREMTDPAGAFYATLDADSEGEEGRFYLWTTAEVRRVLGDDEARLVIDYYGMTEAGNFRAGQNILYVPVPVPLPDFARRKQLDGTGLRARLDADRAILLAVRDRRPRPHRDGKILTAWNGLMISTLARAAQITGDDAWRASAERAATAIAARVQSGDGRLRASWTSGRAGPPGYLDDYAFLARAYLDLHATTGRRSWLDRAASTVRAAAPFRDPGGGFFFTSEEHRDLIARAMDFQDTSLPSGNAIMAECLVRLADALGETGWRDEAARTIRRAAPGMRRSPVAYASMILAAESLESPPAPAVEPAAAGPGAAAGEPAAGVAAGGVARGTVVGRANAERVVEGTIATPALTIRPGQAVTLSLELSIKDGWHVNSHAPTLEYLIPTKVTLPSPGQAMVDSIDYPAGKLVTLEFAKEKLSVYEGRTTIRVNLRPSPDGPDGPQGARAIVLRVGYQACSHKVCLAPETLEFSVLLTVEGEPVALSPAPADAAGAVPGDAPGATDGAGGMGAVLAERGLLGFLVLIFLAGLALDLTPCVYPLVPVTISFFAGQASGSWGRRIALPSLYVLGMALTYSLLGVAAGLSGGLFGATLQNPWIVGVLVLLFVGMALSMFGLFEFRLPGFLTRFGGGRRGPIGALIMGLTMGIVAAPCIGPFVVGLLAFVGASGKPILGFWLFFVMALGMGLPFLVLGVFSGALANLPRSGGWLIYAKKVMGIGLLAVALYFLQPFLSDRVLGWAALGFGVGAGLYLAFLERTRMAARSFPVVKSAIGAAVVVVTLWLALPLVQTRPGPAWRPYSHEAYAAALSSGQPVIIDFFADWCLPCKELDRFTFSNPLVLDETRRFVLLKADLTQFESSQVRDIRDRFAVIGVPTIVFVDSRGQEPKDLRLYGFEEVPAFVARLQKVR